SLYLQKPMSEPASRAFLERVKKTANVASALYVSPEEGLAALQEQEGMQDMIPSLPDNPLPGMIDVSPAPGLSPEKIEQLYQTLRANPEVAQAKLDTVWVKRLHALWVFLKKASHVLMGVLGVAVIFIVGNTLRTTIQKRSEEIKVLKFIGASDAYIARPILYAGVLLGLGGALLAWGLIQILLYSLSLALSPLLSLYDLDVMRMSLSAGEVGYLMFGSLVLGWVGAYVSIKQQLYTVL
ncbi:MAG: cell division protein FtsX, partial [Legionellaceae bacterium]